MAANGKRLVAERIGVNLKRVRDGAGFSQDELGIGAELHRTEIGLLERGERLPRIDTALKLAGTMGVGVQELLVGIAWTAEGEFAFATNG